MEKIHIKLYLRERQLSLIAYQEQFLFKMKSTIAVSTRLSKAIGYEEDRDSISRDWISLFSNLSINNYILLPNIDPNLIGGLKIYSRTLNLYTVESNISQKLSLVQKKIKKSVDIGSYPFFRLGKIGVSIVIRSSNKNRLQSCHKNIIKMIKNKKIKTFKGN